MTKAALVLAEAIPAVALAAFDDVVKTMDKGETSDVPNGAEVSNVVELIQPTSPEVVHPTSIEDGLRSEATDDTRAPQEVAKVVGPTFTQQLSAGAFLIGKAIGSTVKAIDNGILWVGNLVRNAAAGSVSLIAEGACGVIHGIAYAYAFSKVVAEVGAKRGQRAGGKYFHTTK